MNWSENDRAVIKYLKAYKGFSVFLSVMGGLGFGFGVYLIVFRGLNECTRENNSLMLCSIAFIFFGYLLWHSYSLIEKLLKDNNQNG